MNFTVEQVKAGLVAEQFDAKVGKVDVCIDFYEDTVSGKNTHEAHVFVVDNMNYQETANFSGAKALEKAVAFANKAVKKLAA